MSKQIKITYMDKTYTLEFSKGSVRRMEQAGFDRTELAAKTMTMLPQLFAGAFIKNHALIDKKIPEKIYDLLPNKIDMLDKLTEMFEEPYNAMLEDPDPQEVEAKNVSWTASW